MNPYLGALIGALGYAVLRKNGNKCHEATEDKKLNRWNKEHAVEVAAYGPDPFGSGAGLSQVLGEGSVTMPDGSKRRMEVRGPYGHEDYWERKATLDNEPVEVAKEEICGNCSYFDVSDQMVKCGGAGGKIVAVICAISGHPRPTRERGFCQMYKFSCSAFRSCDNWQGGGPRGM